ncbi:hypothetical protein Q8F55_004443 [Vanrija albida]|uniref:Uncharacterized protein n=1 Tax=Vanrija albida TaxID=181172 RepID=A0ABR3Q7E0_9TREE
MAPGDKLDAALNTLVGKLKAMEKFDKTKFALSLDEIWVFVLDYDWQTNGSPGTTAQRGGSQPLLTLTAKEGEFSYSKDAPTKGTQVYALQGPEDLFVSFITPNDVWAEQKLDSWTLLSGGRDKNTQDDVAYFLDQLSWAAYQIDGDKGIKEQATKLGLPKSSEAFLRVYFAVRNLMSENNPAKGNFLEQMKPKDIYDFVVKGDNPDPVRLRVNTGSHQPGSGSVTFNVKNDNTAKITWVTDDETFYNAVVKYDKKTTDEAFAAGKITVSPKPATKADKDWAAYLFDHLVFNFGTFGRYT